MRQVRISSVILILIITQCCKNDRTFPEGKKLTDFQNTEFIPTLEHKITKDKNSIYCSTLLLAWDEVKNTIKTPLQIDSSLYDLNLLNSSWSYFGTLRQAEYFSEVEIDGDLIIARAEFRKSLPFELRLNSFDNELIFDNQKVKSFGIFGYNYETSGIIQVLYYKNDSNFILRLSPKDKEHEILLYMTEGSFKTMSDLIEEIGDKLKVAEIERQNIDLSWKFSLTDNDEVVIPKFDFNIETNYSTLEGKTFKSEETNFRIEEAWQRTAFILDEKGAEIESESEIVVTTDSVAVEVQQPRPKKMRFEKPFFLMLKRVDNENPYFGLWAADSELMSKE